VLVSALFVITGLVAVAGQLRITAWVEKRRGTSGGLTAGLIVLAVAFVPLVVVPGPDRFGAVAAIVALLLTTALLAVGTAAVFPFEMNTVISLSGGNHVATHYGFYSTIVGVGILVGTFVTGAVVDAARTAGMSWIVWAGLNMIGMIAAHALYMLERPKPVTAH
jgi:MFS family permease